MARARARLRWGPGLRLPRRTARLRFTALYGCLFLLSGTALVATTYVLFERATAYHQPALPRVPRAPAALRSLRPGLPAHAPSLANAIPQLAKAQYQLSQDQHQLARKLTLNFRHPLSFSVPALVADERQLTRDQQQLAAVRRQLAQAVHQVSQAGSVQAAQRAADSHQLLIDSGIALAVVALLALALGWLVAGRMLRPIRTITRTARRISSASLHERLALEGPQDELKELGDTLDALFDRLEASFEAQRLFVANASHELRTPLARQRALIQVALADPQANFTSLRSAHERVLATEQHLEQMIEALLTLTRGQAGLKRREPLDLAVLATRALDGREAEFAGTGLDVRAALAPAATAGDPRLLERLIANLIDNAIRHNIPRGQIEIATGAREDGVFISVVNTGPVVGPQEMERLFDPFQRLGAERTGHRTGHGLGLSIVLAIATAHGAILSARPGPQGGLALEISFAAATAVDSAAAAPPTAPALALQARQ